MYMYEYSNRAEFNSYAHGTYAYKWAIAFEILVFRFYFMCTYPEILRVRKANT